jgi:peptidoglycan/LPS O-acetylase OafA/YrhL
VTPRRDLTLAAATLVVLLALLPAYGRVFSEPQWRAPAVLAGLLAIALAAGVRRIRGGALLSLVVTLVGLTCFTYIVHLPTGGCSPARTRPATPCCCCSRPPSSSSASPPPPRRCPGSCCW